MLRVQEISRASTKRWTACTLVLLIATNFGLAFSLNMSSPLDRRRRNLFALGNGAATKQQGAKKKEGTQRCQSIILLSPGRSATDTISKTMVDSTPLSFCKETKEFFGRRHPSSSALSECFSDNRNGVYIHVKPQHILLSGTKTNGTLQTPEAFFRAATHSGYRIVVVGWRDNQLACLVSSYEMKYKPSDPVAMQKFGGLLATFEKVVKRQNRALAAAMANHFKIVSINFNDIVQVGLEGAYFLHFLLNWW